MKYIISLVVVIILVIGGYYVYNRPNSTAPINTSEQAIVTDPVSNSDKTSPVTPSNNTATPTTYTMADIAVHKNASSCYATINGIVYDLTTWITRHPGGQQEILSICGRDGSAAFSGQHSGQARPEQLLAGFKIGVLAK